MKEVTNYNQVIQELMDNFWGVKHLQSLSSDDRKRIQDAYELALDAHKEQKRKDGGPYITHPISVAHILAEEFNLDANSIMAGFLHDVVEDTHYTIDDIRTKFGDDVAYIVGAVTKTEKERYEMSKQIDNYKQMLSSIHFDIRALLVKIADRLHNMRTLSSMSANKQMKIAGETDYFYAPLANRLGLYDVKTKLENLSMQFRCPQEYEELEEEVRIYKKNNKEKLDKWCGLIERHLAKRGIEVTTHVKYSSIYTLWKKMQQTGGDFKHIDHKYAIQIIFDESRGYSEKDYCLKIYSALTDLSRELPGSIRNYVDAPKDNGYQAFHVKVLASFGTWRKIQIASQRMVYNSRMGCLSNRADGVNGWITKFKNVLKDLSFNNQSSGFMDNIVTNFYNDNITVFTPEGDDIVLPKGSSVLDFAYEIHSSIGTHAQFARINGNVVSVKTVLQRGDCIKVETNDNITPKSDWLLSAKTYKAKKSIGSFLRKEIQDDEELQKYDFCPQCSPLPGEEVIGFIEEEQKTIVHKRNCPAALRLASHQGDRIINVELKECSKLHEVTISIIAIDRGHLLNDLVSAVTEELNLPIINLTTTTTDEIVNCTIDFNVHSARELKDVIKHIKSIPSIEEVKREK